MTGVPPDPSFLGRVTLTRGGHQPGPGQPAFGVAALPLTALNGVSSEVLGGLIVESLERDRDRERQRSGPRDQAVSVAILRHWSLRSAALALAAGRRAVHPRPMPGWVPQTLTEGVRDRTAFYRRDWFVVRVVERVGRVELPVDAHYVSAMICGLTAPWSWEDRDPADPARWFTGDPELVERGLWRLFDEPGLGVSLTTEGPTGPFSSAFATMLADGRLDRLRVLDATLKTLGQDWRDHPLRWFVRLLDYLAPALPELAARHTTLVRLLRSESSAVVAASLARLGQLQEAGRLEGRGLADHLVPAVSAGTKANALRSLGLLAISPDDDDAQGRAAEAALHHSNTDVQRAGTAMLATLGRSPASRPTNLTPPVAAYHPIPLPARVTAVDLPDRLAALLEDASEVLELELVLDRLAQTTDATVLTPLRKRARSILAAGGDWQGPHWLPGQLARIIVTALGDTGVMRHSPPGRVPRFLLRRLDEVERVLTGQAPVGPLLATPDEVGGFVSARSLAIRLPSVDLDHRRADAVAALLRLSPDGRSAARTKVRGSDQLSRALRHALGGRGTTAADVLDRDLWIAAARSRAPLSDDPILVAAGLDEIGTGRGLDGSVAPRLISEEDEERPVFEEWRDAAQIKRTGRESDDRPFQPTLVHPDHIADDPRGAWINWAATVWPHDAEHFLIQEVDTFLAGPMWSWWPAAPLLQSLHYHPGRMGIRAASIVTFGLAGGLEDQIRAADLMIMLTATDRLRPAMIAEAMAVAAGACVATRWAVALRTAADGGGAVAVREILSRLLPRLPVGHPGLYALLELLHDEQVRASDGAIHPALRAHLQTFRGSSKAARTARTLLAL